MYKPIYEEIVEASASTWDMKPLIAKIPKVIEDVKNIMQQSLQSNENAKDIPLDTTEVDDWINIAAFEELRKLTSLNLKAYDLSTEAVGSFFIKNLQLFFTICKDYMKPTMVKELLNEIFTLPEQSLSLTDIALIYTANDFRVIDANNYFESSKQLNQSLRDCLQDFQTFAVFIKKTDDVEISAKEYKHGHSYKALEPSPCLNLKKFPKCSHYCTLHKHFFEKTPLPEFTTLMKYAVPQRKIR